MELLIVVTELKQSFPGQEIQVNLTWDAQLGSPCATEFLLHHWQSWTLQIPNLFLVYSWFIPGSQSNEQRCWSQEIQASRNPGSHHGPRAWVAAKMQNCFPLKYQRKGQILPWCFLAMSLTCSAQAIDTLKPNSNRIFSTLIKNLTISWFNIRHPQSLIRNDITKTKAGNIWDGICCSQQ